MSTEENKTTEIDQSKPETNTIKTADEQEMFNLDVCFLLDCTGSMQPAINMASDKIKEIISELKAQYADSQVRIAIVCYRDNGDLNQYQVFAFDESVDAAHNFLGSLVASGGGDAPEDVNGGFRKALALEWKNYTTKMMYHLADAPCHGTKFHYTSDSHPNGLSGDEPWEDLLKKVFDMDINYLYFDIGGSTQKMYDEFKKIYEACGEKSHLIFSYEKLAVPSSSILTTPSYSHSVFPTLAPCSITSTTSSMPFPELLSLTTTFDAMPTSSFSPYFDMIASEKSSFSEEKKKSSECEEMFVKATVKNAQTQMMKNFEYQKARIDSKF